MGEQALKHGFAVDRPVSLGIDNGRYSYIVHRSRDIGEKYGITLVTFDAYTGAFVNLSLTTGVHSGNTLTTWLIELHICNVFGLPYRILVCVVGLAIVILSVTGVYVWLHKRRARKLGAARRRRRNESARAVGAGLSRPWNRPAPGHV